MSLVSTFITSVEHNTNVATQTFTGIDFGSGSADLYAVVAVAYGTAGVRVPSSVTIEGVAATRVATGGSASGRSIDLWYANIPDGGVGSVVVVCGGNTNNVGIGVWTVRGALDTTFIQTDAQTGATSYGSVLSSRAGGVGIAAVVLPSGGTETWSEPTAADYDSNNTLATTFHMAGAHEASTVAGTWQPFLTLSSSTSRYVAACFNPKINGDAAQVLTSFTAGSQALSVTESMPSTIGTTLSKMTQAAQVMTIQSSAIVQTLTGISQDFEGHIQTGDDGPITTVLFGMTQEADVVVGKADIAQTLPGFTQQITALMVPNADIAQTLPGFTQAANVAVEKADIDQTLPGFTQLLSGGMVPNGVIDQTLPGFNAQAANVIVKIPTAIAQTLPGFAQEIDDTESMSATINMVLGVRTGTLDSAFVTHRETGTAAATQTFTGIDFGPANANLLVVVALAYGSAGIRLPQSMTIGGVTATRLNRSAAITARCVDLWYASVPAGGIGSVQVVYGGSNNGSIGVWTVRGPLDAIIPSDIASNNTTYNPSLAARSGAVGIIAAASNATFTFTDPAVADYAASETPSTAYKVTGGHEAVFASSWQPFIQSGSAITNYISAVFMPSVGATPALTQELDASVSTTISIDQTLPGFSQELDVSDIAAQIDQTLRPLTQAATGTVVEPENVIAQLVDTVLPTFVQEIDINVTPNADIDQTLLGISQEIDITTIPNVETIIDAELMGFTQNLMVEVMTMTIDQTLEGFTQNLMVEVLSANIDQTFEGFTQRADVIESIPVAIDQTLQGISQEIDVIETIETAIDTQLAGFGQEIDVVVEMTCTIDQTLPGFQQEFDGDVEEPPGVIAAFIDQTLPGFQQDIDVSALRIDIAAELMGFTQRAVVVAPLKRKPRENHAAIMPSKEMPIHPAELEFFRRKVYARAVDALVPPPVTARYNLTTRQYPTSRISVDRTPLGKKPS